LGIRTRRYRGSAPCGAFNHFLIVFRDRLVSLAISLIDGSSSLRGDNGIH
jgi:hypothetical protein